MISIIPLFSSRRSRKRSSAVTCQHTCHVFRQPAHFRGKPLRRCVVDGIAPTPPPPDEIHLRLSALSAARSWHGQGKRIVPWDRLDSSLAASAPSSPLHRSNLSNACCNLSCRSFRSFRARCTACLCVWTRSSSLSQNSTCLARSNSTISYNLCRDSSTLSFGSGSPIADVLIWGAVPGIAFVLLSRRRSSSIGILPFRKRKRPSSLRISPTALTLLHACLQTSTSSCGWPHVDFISLQNPAYGLHCSQRSAMVKLHHVYLMFPKDILFL